MGLVDPFAAASKPMRDWDSVPSRPLPFAATLHALDLNTPSTPRLPRPLRGDYEELPKIFPSPPYSHARHGSQSTSLSRSANQAFSPSQTMPRGDPGSDEWMECMVADCLDNAKSDLFLHGFGLESVSTNIRDLRDLVTLSTKSPAHSPSPASPWPPRSPFAETSEQRLRRGERSLARTQSAPASAPFFSGLNGTNQESLDISSGSLLPAPPIGHGQPVHQNPSSTGRRFTRSKTGTVPPTETQSSMAVYLSQNRLTSLPTALFEIRNLTYLTLRHNQLRSLPAAIGDLVNLEGLNISNNLIEYLPSTIFDLKSLKQFYHDPNPWLKPPAVDDAEQRTGRVLSPLRTFQTSPVPRLASLCLTVLLSPCPPTNLPPFMAYDWDAQRINGKHPLLDVEGLQQEILPEVAVADLRRIVQAVKSGCDSGAGVRQAPTRSALADRFPASHRAPPPDDASTNMYYNPCPSPRHQDGVPLHRRVFLHPAEERIEWRDVKVKRLRLAKGLPVRWLGCSPGCLSFLEEDDDEDDEDDEDEAGEENWPMEGFAHEPAWQPGGPFVA